MIDHLYQLIQQAGYTHPLHPVATHLPVGCIMAAFFFLLISSWFRKPAYFQTARHCIGLALAILPITALLGYLDWQHNMAGALIWPIKVKLSLAGGLFLFLMIAINLRRNLSRPGALNFIVYLICLVLVTGLGYFGGELVYGSKPAESKTAAVKPAEQHGAILFQQKCSFCHHHDQTTTKVGPGLKGLSQMPNLPTSGWPMSEQSLRKQIVTPFKDMPPFETLSDAELNHLIAFLETL